MPILKKYKTVILLLLFCLLKSNAQKTLYLPQIKQLKYLSVSSGLESVFSKNSCQDSLGKLLKTYNKKLKNIGQYEVYLVNQSCKFSQSTCLCFETNSEGKFDFLIFFNKKSKKAFALISSYDFLSDSEVYIMHFRVKKNEIILTDSSFTEGEGGKPERLYKNTITVRVLKNGEIQVKP